MLCSGYACTIQLQTKQNGEWSCTMRSCRFPKHKESHRRFSNYLLFSLTCSRWSVLFVLGWKFHFIKGSVLDYWSSLFRVRNVLNQYLSNYLFYTNEAHKPRLSHIMRSGSSSYSAAWISCRNSIFFHGLWFSIITVYNYK